MKKYKIKLSKEKYIKPHDTNIKDMLRQNNTLAQESNYGNPHISGVNMTIHSESFRKAVNIDQNITQIYK